MKLDPFQKRGVDALLKLLVGHNKVCAVSPTGSGKTVVAADVLAKLLRQCQRALAFAHRRELHDQFAQQLLRAGLPASHIGILNGTTKRNTDARILITSPDMFRKRDLPPGIELLVFDECHHIAAAGYQKILYALPDVPVLGLTATPERLDGKPLGDSFTHLHVIAGMTELLTSEHPRIANPITYGVPREKARALVAGVRTLAGDYAQAELGRAAMKCLMGDVVAETMRLAKGKSTIVFATNREHGRALAKRFAAAGSTAEYLDGETSNTERTAILARLRDGETQIVINVAVLIEGFDCPAVKCIVLARPTKSLTMFLQQCGRGARLYKGTRPLILDFAGNTWTHGMPTREREWSLDGREKTTGNNDAPVKHCAACGAMQPVAARVCGECGAELPLTEREIGEQQAELERLHESADERRRKEEVLRKLAAGRGLGEEWIAQQLSDAQ